MTQAPEQLSCSNCNAPIPNDDWNREHAFCTACRAPVSVLVFPALYAQPDTASAGTPVVEAGESSCFYHPQKRAVVPCDQCGRFLCALCRVEFLGQNWCPRCIEASTQKGRLAHLDTSRALHDNTALALAILPMFLIWPTIVTAPVTLYLVIRNWRAPASILPRTKIRFVIAALLALAQIAVWLWFGYFVAHRR